MTEYRFSIEIPKTEGELEFLEEEFDGMDESDIYQYIKSKVIEEAISYLNLNFEPK